MKNMYKILLICGLLVAVSFAVYSVDDTDEEETGGNETTMDGGCPPECNWGCYPDGECCPEPIPGYPDNCRGGSS